MAGEDERQAAAPVGKKKPAKPQPRNLVVCCDGTSNEIGVKLSNVLKLYRIADKDETQIVYYDPGIGTISMPKSWGRLWQWLRAKFEMATGAGLNRDVLDAYCFLCRHYRDGDRVFLFGFSRGAYTVRVVAGMIYLIGLLREHQVNFAGYAMRAYKGATAADDYELARLFNRTVNGRQVPIHFMGVWDTVSSVIVPGRLPFTRLRFEELPYTTANPAVRTFRHAIAIDEFRRMFRIQRWTEGQAFKPNPFSRGKTIRQQDCRQVWFAGCHSDIGGGFVETQSAPSKFPLLWMLDQAKLHRLKLRERMIDHMVRGEVVPGWRVYTAPDHQAKLHNSLWPFWWVLEIFPKGARWRDWPKRWRFGDLYLPLGEPRFVPHGSFIHQSVLGRRQVVSSYRPVNLPPEGNFQVEL